MEEVQVVDIPLNNEGTFLVLYASCGRSVVIYSSETGPVRGDDDVKKLEFA